MIILQSEGARRIAEERNRQIDGHGEGWTPEHDDDHSDGELADAAACYADLAGAQVRGATIAQLRDLYLANTGTHPDWPWDDEWFKPVDDPVRNLEKAGALIAAEIDRLLRARNGGEL